MVKRILAVDDSPIVLSAIAIVLESIDYVVQTAKDGVDALDVLKREKEKFNAIITDVNMPNMDGVTLTAEIRKLPGYGFTPIIILTTESQTSKKEEGKKAGATGWLVKPVKPDMLLATMKKICS
ncbi:MAG: response regulator [Deltaproteobacteria bacterium]|nr:response regulator [Deltaproteobacteria bacterium]